MATTPTVCSTWWFDGGGCGLTIFFMVESTAPKPLSRYLLNGAPHMQGCGPTDISSRWRELFPNLQLCSRLVPVAHESRSSHARLRKRWLCKQQSLPAMAMCSCATYGVTKALPCDALQAVLSLHSLWKEPETRIFFYLPELHRLVVCS